MEYNGRFEDKDGNILNPKTTPKQAGLGNVKNYPINSNLDANSDEEYASTSMVAKVREEKVSKRDIINNLTTNDDTKPLGAGQGRELKRQVDAKANSNHTHEYLPYVSISRGVDKRRWLKIATLNCESGGSAAGISGLIFGNADFGGRSMPLIYFTCSTRGYSNTTIAIPDNLVHAYQMGSGNDVNNVKFYAKAVNNTVEFWVGLCVFTYSSKVTLLNADYDKGGSIDLRTISHNKPSGTIREYGIKQIQTVSTYSIHKQAEEKLLKLELEDLNG